MLMAQGQGLQIAIDGGAEKWQQDKASGQFAPEAGLEVRYLVRWRVMPNTQLGLYTGLGGTYSKSTLEGSFTNQFTRQDYLGNTIEYTTSAAVSEQHRNIQVSLPVLFAFQTHGVALNIGPKLLWLALDNYQSTLNSATIDAYYPAYKVHVINQPSTGHIDVPSTQQGTGTSNNLQLTLSAELGYEWQLGNPYSRDYEHYIGVQLYANYGVWSASFNTNQPMLSVAPISSASASPQITVGTIQGLGSSLSSISFGLRLYYTLQTVDYRGRGWHRWH